MKKVFFSLMSFTAISLAILVVARQQTQVHQGLATTKQLVAITFDDGPNPPFTDAILRILKKHGAHATFFVLGENAASYPGTVQRICDEGHEIGNHTFSHPTFSFSPPPSIIEEIQATDRLIAFLCPQNSAAKFRAPYANHSINVALALKKINRKNILFSVAPNPPDYLRPSPYQIAHSILEQIHPGAIVSLHDGEANQAETVSATDIVIKELTQRGYRLVTVSEILSPSALL